MLDTAFVVAFPWQGIRSLIGERILTGEKFDLDDNYYMTRCCSPGYIKVYLYLSRCLRIRGISSAQP